VEPLLGLDPAVARRAELEVLEHDDRALDLELAVEEGLEQVADLGAAHRHAAPASESTWMPRAAA
jgi:hypothetical protein